MYTQNNEEQIILDYFNQKTNDMCVLDIGANDGKTFSNSLKLIELGWNAVLIEPSPKAFDKLINLHKENTKVHCYPLAISNTNGKVTLKESSSLINKNDVALVSSLKEEETIKWRKANVRFQDTEVMTLDFISFYNICPIKKYDFISIDIEGFDYDVLIQIDLDLVSCSCLCVEFNGKESQKYIDYVAKYNMKLTHKNPENLIFTK